MFNSKCKKTISLALTLLIFTSTLVGLSSCTDDDNNGDITQKPICEISYMWNGEMQTDRSTVTLIFGAWSTIYQAEYDAAPEKYRFSQQKSPEIYQASVEPLVFINLSKDSSKPSSILGLRETDKDNEIFLSYAGDWGIHYKKSTFIEFVYNYVYVDIIDHQTLSITTWKGTTVYTVSSYSITYFDDLK